jgi:polar amino acid transport system substrate-binding protein
MKSLFLALLVLSSFTLAQDLQGRVLSVGSDTTYPPFEFINDAGEVVGFDVDILNAICAEINCVAEFQTTAWDGIFPALASGEFDMVASGVSITPERDEIVDFSDPYLTVSQSITVRVEDEDYVLTDFTEGELLLAAQTGTTNANLAEELVGRDRLQLYDTFNAAVLALINGDVDGVIIDGTAADAFVQEYAGELVVNIDGLSADPLGLVFQEGDALVDDFNAGLAAIRESGVYDEIVARWFAPAE